MIGSGHVSIVPFQYIMPTLLIDQVDVPYYLTWIPEKALNGLCHTARYASSLPVGEG
jgi:hypothetical protein